MDHGNLDVFDINCMRQEYNAAYNRLKHLVMDGLISSEEFYSQLEQLKLEYEIILNPKEESE